MSDLEAEATQHNRMRSRQQQPVRRATVAAFDVSSSITRNINKRVQIMTAETSRPKVILLAGFPNSGTTIASYILGQHPNIFATGELYGFPARQLKPLKVCSCGALAVACPFWTDVAAALMPLADASAAVRAQAVYASVCRHSGRPFIVDVA
ncbi:sulfotransferase family protein [Defluviicoccus vanus]|uniref:Sulfotransferase n=1 Tax=Defluviicoccus vanus TaxID=111831 RepID=A0A7H1MZQ8_9PROT|nr:hypothetical protein [Defluviicoccus vanus]QNT68944.1 hypothetical protein HQ394_05715 [Defluviicoccus vanus]